MRRTFEKMFSALKLGRGKDTELKNSGTVDNPFKNNKFILRDIALLAYHVSRKENRKFYFKFESQIYSADASKDTLIEIVWNEGDKPIKDKAKDDLSRMNQILDIIIYRKES